jgi:hypothetical protein
MVQLMQIWGIHDAHQHCRSQDVTADAQQEQAMVEAIASGEGNAAAMPSQQQLPEQVRQATQRWAAAWSRARGAQWLQSGNGMQRQHRLSDVYKLFLTANRYMAVGQCPGHNLAQLDDTTPAEHTSKHAPKELL